MTNDELAAILADAAVWNISGLSITLIGVFLLYRFGMPFRVRRKPGEVTWTSEGRDLKAEAIDSRYARWGRFGLLLIMVGTGAQIVGAYLGR